MINTPIEIDNNFTVFVDQEQVFPEKITIDFINGLIDLVGVNLKLFARCITVKLTDNETNLTHDMIFDVGDMSYGKYCFNNLEMELIPTPMLEEIKISLENARDYCY